ncbi:MAG: ATP-binding protein [Candidatus Tectimicrobiota bacterium]
MTHRQMTQMFLYALLVGLGLSVLLLDLVLPLGGSICMLYAVLLGVAMVSQHEEYTWHLAAGYTACMILGFLCLRTGQSLWIESTNRLLALGLLWGSFWCMGYRQLGGQALWRSEASTPTVTGGTAEVAAREASLRQQRDWLDGTLASLGEAVMTTDARLSITFLNRAAENLIGWQAVDACNRPLGMVLRLCEASTRKPVTVPLERVVQEGVATDLGEQLRLLRPDGQVRAIAGYGTPLQDGQGRVQGVVLVIRDLTAPKRLEAQMRQSQKLAAIGTLAGGIAHEFNNLLAAILGFTELALEDLPGEHGTRQHLQKVLQAGLRAKQVVLQLLTFSRQTPPVREAVQLNKIIQDVMTLLRASLPSTITVHVHGSAREDTVVADPTQLHHVVMHLAANAGDAMREKGGRLEISVDTVHAPANPSTPPDLPPGPYVRLRVRDTGCGMPPEVQERIFEPFFTTKEVGQGTGLGLATVHGIVASYGGAISVASRVGRGTTFTVYLPQVPAVSEMPDAAPAVLPQGHGRVLVVDDEAMLVQVSCARLQRLGYEGVGCTDTQAALEMFQAAPQSFDLVLTDYTMPGMTGVKLTRALKHLRADIPVILCSGAYEGLDASRALGQGVAAVLLKPWSLQELATTIQRVRAVTPPSGKHQAHSRPASASKTVLVGG